MHPIDWPDLTSDPRETPRARQMWVYVHSRCEVIDEAIFTVIESGTESCNMKYTPNMGKFL